ncbi:uncharacterized protein LOC125646012 [Ostrea edulis]|uniref:uncharacterized protein LOC125646012 n=1 Tax=Ostrea edulis TaxID=37623 RepID=UPI0024AFD678|nr:uncharacterized protein LOC125646012 [Ostrea edulis]XP_048728073.2 uncharacterized protein LOC125646012 [Ostrea edulis]XP_048728074.2 uncharacterized protein LOC125646012 [Ostrea edulis]XP_048728075.2 uncharacterized protein LOC125646012 [Ostrea edulis]XP_048728076.2 uncharacterized protein LOC125646012 [Ostrea edulis]XP_048728077.2 uncharacterized protein LOC125646012 [Ostrea edulis]
MSECTEHSSLDEHGSRGITPVSDEKCGGEFPSETGDHGRVSQNAGSKSLQITGRNKDTVSSQIENLSPTTRGKLQLIIESLSNHTAVVGEDERGLPTVQYNQKQKLYWDGSNANKIAVPKSDQDLKTKTSVCLEMLEYMKLTKAPSGVVLDKTKIHTDKGQYREEIEFEKTKEVLGRGNSAGDIVVIKDKGTHADHALKTILISVFRPEEIKAWVDLSEDGICPELYLFRLEGNRVVVHMEKLDNAVTLNEVINVHMNTIRQTNVALMKPFSLSIFHNILNIVQSMHEKGWSHRDLHSGNVMLQKGSDYELKVKVLDFGNAGRIEDKGGYHGIKSDILNAVRNFSALYLGEEFESQVDLERNWRKKILDRMQGLPNEEKAEMFCLFETALKVVTAEDIGNLKQFVDEMALIDGKVNGIMKEVLPIIFPEVSDQNNESDTEDAVDFAPVNLDRFMKKLRESIMIGY